jgi:putative SOS response-associated peptidase YedK
MCNRVAALLKPEALAGQLKITEFEDGALPRPNVAPTDPMPAIINSPNGLRLVSAKWGKPGANISTMNARDDNLEGPTWGPMLRNKSGRAVVPISHGFEPFTATTLEQMGHDEAVKNLGGAAVKEIESGATKTLWHGIKRRDGKPMLIAALVDVDDEQRRWTTLVTAPAGPVFSRIHRAKLHGQPREIVTLRTPAEAEEWLSGTMDYRHLLRGAGDDLMESWRCPPEAMKKDADPLLKTQAWAPSTQPPVPKGQNRLF